MKRFLYILAVLPLFTLSAQELKVKVHLNQAVAAGNVWLQPGDYMIKPTDMEGTTLRIQSADGRAVFVMAEKEFLWNPDHTIVQIDNSGIAPHIAKIEVEGSEIEYVLPAPTERLAR